MIVLKLLICAVLIITWLWIRGMRKRGEMLGDVLYPLSLSIPLILIFVLLISFDPPTIDQIMEQGRQKNHGR